VGYPALSGDFDQQAFPAYPSDRE